MTSFFSFGPSPRSPVRGGSGLNWLVVSEMFKIVQECRKYFTNLILWQVRSFSAINRKICSLVREFLRPLRVTKRPPNPLQGECFRKIITEYGANIYRLFILHCYRPQRVSRYMPWSLHLQALRVRNKCAIVPFANNNHRFWRLRVDFHINHLFCKSGCYYQKQRNEACFLRLFREEI